MAIERCENGHYYDAEKYAVCPHCSSGSYQEGNDDLTIVGLQLSNDEQPLVNAQNNIPEQASDILQPEQSDKLPVSLLPMDSGQLSEKTNAAIKASIAAYTGDDITLVLAQTYNMDPVVGWLVCIEGDERGRDICLHSGQNFFGCKEDKTLLVASDAQSAPENHGAIVYDPKHNQFFIIANSAGEVKLNGEALSGSSQLKDADRIEVAGARYIFAALCKESFRWE